MQQRARRFVNAFGVILSTLILVVAITVISIAISGAIQYMMGDGWSAFIRAAQITTVCVFALGGPTFYVIFSLVARLGRTEEELTKLIDNSPAGIIHIDEKFNVKIMNPEMIRILGIATSAQAKVFTDHPLSDLAPVSHFAPGVFLDALSRGEKMKVEAVIEVDGQEKIIDIIGAPLMSESWFSGAVLLITDVTDAKRAEREIREARDRAEEATKLKDQFVSLVSHDLRSPLASVILATDHMLRPGVAVEQSENRDRFISYIKDNVGGLMNLIDTLLDITRLSSGKVRVVRKVVNARELVAEKWVISAPAAAMHNITFDNQIAGHVNFLADPGLVGQVVQNLLTNAVKFTGDGGTITATLTQDETGLSITDTGQGVDPDFLTDLFNQEIKTTLRGVRGERGTGLGLPYSHDIVAAHGGQLTVDSVEGKGSTFTFTLPVAGKVVLVVDDQPAHREMVKEALLGLGPITPIEAAGGEEALHMLSKTLPHLMITDIQMPGMDGYELIEKVRSDHRYNDMPILVSSSDISFEKGGLGVIEERLGRGVVQGLMPKPVAKNVMETHLAAILAGSAN